MWQGSLSVCWQQADSSPPQTHTSICSGEHRTKRITEKAENGVGSSEQRECSSEQELLGCHPPGLPRPRHHRQTWHPSWWGRNRSKPWQWSVARAEIYWTKANEPAAVAEDAIYRIKAKYNASTIDLSRSKIYLASNLKCLFYEQRYPSRVLT